MGIADEASPSIEGQIRATKKLGWKWIEARFAEVDGFEKALCTIYQMQPLMSS